MGAPSAAWIAAAVTDFPAEDSAPPTASFASRIAAVSLGTAIGVLVLAIAILIGQEWNHEREVSAQHRAATARMYAQALASDLANRHEGDVGAIVASMRNLGSLEHAMLYDSSGALYARYDRTERDVERGPGRGSGRAAPATGASIAEPVPVPGQPPGRLVLQFERRTFASLLPRYLALTGALLFAATGLALFLSRWLAARLVEPLKRLAAAMVAVGESGDFDRRLKPAPWREFDQVTQAFNGLLAALGAKDVALRGTLSALVEARDAAEHSNVLKSQFLANMSHEIRTPLNGVLAMAQAMEAGDLSGEQRSRLLVIRQSGEALLAVLNDILDLSKIEAGRLELESRAFDLAHTLDAVVAPFSALVIRKGLEMRVDIAPDCGRWRVGDPDRLGQILSNLVSNAVKFTEQGGIYVRVERAGEDVLFTVRDTGMGMPAERIPGLFEKFTQLDQANTRRYGGTGLGLAICRELCGMMGGSIEAESAPGEGSTFRVRLPMPEAAPPAEAATGSSAAPALPTERPLRVLAAEDNPTNQLVLKTIMPLFGLELSLVENGREAVQAWEARDFDLILMDIQMPEMDGVAASRAIREGERRLGRARTPILALSASAMTHQVREYLDAGMDGHVPKPIQLEALKRALATVLAEPGATAAAPASGACAA